MTAISTSGHPHSGALAPDVHSIQNDVNDTWLVFGDDDELVYPRHRAIS